MMPVESPALDLDEAMVTPWRPRDARILALEASRVTGAKRELDDDASIKRRRYAAALAADDSVFDA